ncbi:MAG TPA: cytochrome c oxidase assembly protein [Solirubrobacteraceae bacterium]|nr:cytochrome c oxidase assembly protein [Solirubrobacteraceae bacterium]
MAPSLPMLLWHNWQPAWPLDGMALVAAGAYLAGTARTPRWPWRRTAAFLAGLVAVLVALQSGIGAYDDRLLSDHMVQHLLLLELAPLLLLAGRPVTLAVRGGPRGSRAALARRFAALSALMRPAVCLGLFALVVLATHIPAVYDATLTNNTLHEAEHVLYLVAGLLMWWPMLDADPDVSHRLGGLGRLIYINAAMLPMTLIGVFLYRDPSLFYPGYAAPARALGVSAVADQQQAGIIMWVLGSFVMVVAGLWQIMTALIAEERRMQLSERAATTAVLHADPGRRP